MSGGPASAGAGTAPPFAAAARDLAARRALAIGGVVPEAVATPATRAALVECVREAGDAGAALVPLGLGAHRDLGHAPARYDLALSTRELAAIVDYAPADMTVTVESGVTLAALDVLLTSHGQWLPLDPPLPARTTVGGLLAADLSGPLRASQGRVRDYVLGIAMVTADGRETRAGGRVVKNVAGYDLMKLMVGSLGTLAVITEATLKVRPRPEVTRVIELALADRDAALALAPRLAALGEVALADDVFLYRRLLLRDDLWLQRLAKRFGDLACALDIVLPTEHLVDDVHIAEQVRDHPVIWLALDVGDDREDGREFQE